MAHSISRAGDAFNMVALVVLVFRLTGSGVGVAGLVIFEVLPLVLFAPFAGWLVDRLPRRSVMVTADLVRAGLVGVLAVSHHSVAITYAVALLVAMATVAFNPAASATVPELVHRDELVRANSAIWTVAVVLQLAIAPLAGALIATTGVGVAFAINAASFLASAVFLRRLQLASPPGGGRDDRWWRAVAAGYHAVRSQPLLRRLALAQLLAALSAGATSGLLVVLASRRLGVGPTGFGFLLGAIGLGAVLGPLVLHQRIRPGQRRWLFGPLAVRSVVDVVLASVRDPIVAGAALGAYGLGTSTGTVAFQSTLQATTGSETRGRVFALFDTLWNTARLVSLGLGGLLAEVAGIQAVYLTGAGFLAAAALVGFTGPSRPAGPPTSRTPR